MAWQATHRFARISPRKVKLMVDMIRGRDVQDALNVLRFSPHRAATMVSKVLSSAIANANEQEADLDLLVVREARVDPGPTIKRIKPKDRGRAHLLRKRTSHISVVVEEEEA
jgi:large subunit ribosomal protein L22